MRKLKIYLVKHGYTPLGLYITIHFIAFIIAVPLVIIGYVLSSKYYNDLSVMFICLILALIPLVASSIISISLCRCPGCGRLLRFESLSQTHCMYCGADLDKKFSWFSEVEDEVFPRINWNSSWEAEEKTADTHDIADSTQTVSTKNESTKVDVRRAGEKDIPSLLTLLSQVLEVHARIRPDYFVSGQTKYSNSELEQILDDDGKRVYVAEVDGTVAGYAFCELKEMPDKPFVEHFKYLYIDDLCVDESFRGKDVATKIFEHVKVEAKALGCRDITLNVWAGNDRANAFYKKMGMKPQKTTMEIKL